MLAVTKGFGVDAVAAAAAAGIASIGENYAQELLTKLDAARTAGLDVHFIGRLQSNKVRQLAGAVAVWESIDRPALVAELARRAPGTTVLVQVAATGEPGKGGCPADGVPALVEQARAAGLHVEGLMTVGPTVGGPEAARPRVPPGPPLGRRARPVDMLDGDDRRPGGRRRGGLDGGAPGDRTVRPSRAAVSAAG